MKTKIDIKSGIRSFFLVVYITFFLIEIIQLIKAPHEISLRNDVITSMSGFMQVMLPIFVLTFINGILMMPIFVFKIKDFIKYVIYLIISIILVVLEVCTNLYDYIIIFLILLNVMQIALLVMKYKEKIKNFFTKIKDMNKNTNEIDD